MKILFLNHNVQEFGTYFRAMAISDFFSRKGHSIDFVAVSNDKKLKTVKQVNGNTTSYFTPSLPLLMGKDEGWGLLEILVRLSVVLFKKYDIIYSFDHKPNVIIPALLLKKRNKAFLIADWCDWWGKDGLLSRNAELRKSMISGKPYRLLRHYLQSILENFEEKWEESIPLKHADMVTTICSELMERALKAGIREENLYLLPSGANIKKVNCEDKYICRKKLGFNVNKTLLGFLGNYHPDIPFLINAADNVLKKDKDIHLILITPHSQFLYNQIRKSQYKNRITVTGKIRFDDLSPYLGICDILLLPQEDNTGNRGRLPNKFCDYIAAGRPIVATDVGDVGKYINEYGLGYATKPNEEDFSSKINDLLQNRDEWIVIGERARIIAETVLNWEKLSEDFYNRLLDLKIIK
ncbi:MAG: glycosyltransferase [Candidatus Coatesbacteria bacterium]|nr:glycosyltransferase [Candidatus Coatesbacteria bacterium]